MNVIKCVSQMLRGLYKNIACRAGGVFLKRDPEVHGGGTGPSPILTRQPLSWNHFLTGPNYSRSV